MAFQIIWSEPALDDLRSLTSYIAEHNPSAAERMGLAILKKTRLLADHSLLGRMVPEIGRKEIRELIERPYRIIYRVQAHDKVVEIVRVGRISKNVHLSYQPH
jgi:addiction module RelE/StbE family toxin